MSTWNGKRQVEDEQQQESPSIKELRDFESTVTKGLRRIVTTAEGRERQIAELIAEAKQRDQALAELGRDSKTASKRLDEAERKTAELEQQLRQTDDAARRLEAQEAEQRRRAEQLQRDVAKAEAEKKEEKRRADALEEEVAHLGDRCANAEQQANETRRKALAIMSGTGDVFDGPSLLVSPSGSGPKTPKSGNRTASSATTLQVPGAGGVGSHDVFTFNHQNGGAGREEVIEAIQAQGLHATPLSPNIFVQIQDNPSSTFAPGQGLTCTPEYLHQAMLAYNARLADLKQAVEISNSGEGDENENFERLGRALKAYVDESRRTMLAVSCIPPGSNLALYDELQAKAKKLQEETARLAQSVGLQGVLTGAEADNQRRKTTDALGKCQTTASEALRLAHRFLPKGEDIKADDIATLLEEEMQQMQSAVMNAIQRLEDIQKKARQTEKEGWKLEVDDRILAACKQLAQAIQEITEAAATLQHEIEDAEKGSLSSTEFYKRNIRWTEGLISSAKEITQASVGFVKAADDAITYGKFEEVIVYTKEVSAATVRLAVASRVKAPRNSKALGDVMTGTRNVNQATAAVVLQVRQSLEIMKQREAQQQQAYENFVSGLGAYETNRLEMESKIAAERLASELDREHSRLRTLRKHHAKLVGPDDARRMAQQDRDTFTPRTGGMSNSASGYAVQVLSAGPNSSISFFPPSDENNIGSVTPNSFAATSRAARDGDAR